MKKGISFILAILMCLTLSPMVWGTPITSGTEQTNTAVQNILENGQRVINLGLWCEDAPHGADHVQGICVDDAGKYMYASFTNTVVKLDVETGEIAGTMGGLKTGTHVDGAHIGELTYHNGKIYAAIEYKASARWYIAVIDGEMITEMNMPYTTPGMMQALYVPQIGDAFCEELYAGEHINEGGSMGHRYGASGIDAMTVGKIPGGGYDTDGDGVVDIADDKEYLFTVLSPFGNIKRYDNENMILLMFDFDKMTQQNLRPFTEEDLTREYADAETYRYEHKIFGYTGNQRYGAQQLEYDKDTNDFWLDCYPKDGHGTTEFPIVRRMAIDGAVPLYMDTVEVGQSVTHDAEGFITKAEANKTAALYTDYEDGDGDGDYTEQETGWHFSLKCICGVGMENHEATVYGATGHPTKICGHRDAFYTGLLSLGNNMFYGVENTTSYDENGTAHFGGIATLYRLNRENYLFETYESYPYMLKDFENRYDFGNGASKKQNGYAGTEGFEVRVTGTYTDVSYPVPIIPAEKGDTLYFSAWIKLKNTELKDNKATFIGWRQVQVERTSEDTSLAKHYRLNAFKQVDVKNAGLKKDGWVKVTAKVENWDGIVAGKIPAGYAGYTETNHRAIPCEDGFESITLRLYGPASAEESVSSVEYVIDDVTFYATNPQSEIATDNPEIFDGYAMDTTADKAYWNAPGMSLVEETGPDGSKGYIRIDPGTAWPQLHNGNITIKPNHLYKISMWARVEKVAEGEGEKGGFWFFSMANNRIPDTNGYHHNYPGICMKDVLTNEWKKFDFYYTSDYKTFVSEPYTWVFRFFQGRGESTNCASVYNVDGVRMTDLGPVSNGDFSIGSGNIYCQNTGKSWAINTSYPVFGWTEDGATAVSENGAMKMTVATDGGKVYQGIHMKNGGLYKLSFRAKTSGDAKPFAAVLDRKVPSPGGDKEVYNVPDFQYITGANDISETYENGTWKVTDTWQTYECYISNDFPLMEGKNETANIIPRTPQLYFMADGNKAGTELYIDDVVLEQVSTTPAVSGASVTGVNKPGEALTVNANLSSPKGTDGGCVAVRALLKNGDEYVSLGTLYDGETFTVPENAIGKELVFSFTPADNENIIGKTVYVTPDTATETWSKLYYDEKTKTARIYSSEQTTAEVIFASYKNGELMDVKMVPVKISANTKTTTDGSALASENADTVKVMAWSTAANAIPLCENITIQ